MNSIATGITAALVSGVVMYTVGANAPVNAFNQNPALVQTLDGPFVPGQVSTGHITYPGYEHLQFVVLVESMEPERRFSFRWHPNAIEPDQDYSKEPTTLVEFTLEDAEGGTRLRLVESGFDAIPIEQGSSNSSRMRV